MSKYSIQKGSDGNMLRAQTKEGKFVTLALLPKQQIDELRKGEKFYCPECKGDVIVRAGPKVIPHFAHRTTSQCSHRGGEGAYHQRGKLLLFRWLQNQRIQVTLEQYLPEIKQRPDLLIEIGSKTIAIEYQCATIPIIEIRKRNEGYKRLNITPIWILGANLYKRLSNHHLYVNSFIRQFIHQFTSDFPTTLFYFCPHKKIFAIVHHVFMTSANRALVTQTFSHLKHTHFRRLFSIDSFSKKQLYTSWKKEKRTFRLRTGNAYGAERKWRNWLYEKGIYHHMLPSIVYLPVASQCKMKVPLWNWQSRFIIEFIHPLAIGRMFSVHDAIRFIQPFQHKNNQFPLLSISCPMKEYLLSLCELAVIEQKSNTIFIKKQEIIFYNHIEEAIRGDDELLNVFMYN